jgi:hypothetical protein
MSAWPFHYGFLNFFYKQPLAAQFGQRAVKYPVALCFYNQKAYFHLRVLSGNKGFNVRRLP